MSVDRARVATLVALLIALPISGAAIAASPLATQPLAAVTWPVSTSLLLSEVQTGGASASDEFVEVTNSGHSVADLVGLEVVYVTSTGSTITRKASWTTSRSLAPGQHLLIANSSGIFGSMADVSYSGGFAATGGALALRAIGGAPIDSIGWGDATNAFVEGAAAPAPAANASIERLPGGLGGNTVDTNSNAGDWFIQASPNAQSLSAPPVPAPGPSATPSPAPSESLPNATPGPTPSASPSPSPSASPSASPSPSPSASPISTASPAPSDTPLPTDSAPAGSPAPSTGIPSATPTETATPEPTASPTPTPTPEPTLAPSPTPAPTTTPTATPSETPAPTESPASSAPPSPSPVIVAIAEARAQSDGTSASVIGVLTTRLGALEGSRKAFIQDASGGIAIYLDAPVSDGLPAGTAILVTGTIDDRYAERTLRASLADIVVVGDDMLPIAMSTTTGGIDETLEGTRVLLDGLTVGSPSALADGLGIIVDDGSGPIRAIIGADALGSTLLPSGTHVEVIGPVGQHDSSGTGTTAYRVYATLPDELLLPPTPTPIPTAEPTSTPVPSPTSVPTGTPQATPTPTPTGTPTPTASATPTPTPSPSPTPTPSRTPSPSPTPAPSGSPAPSATSIAAARSAPIGAAVTVVGVVTAEAGRLGTPSLIDITDATGGIVVRVPDGEVAPGRGATIRVTGPLADPYGQLEIRPAASGFHLTGTGLLPSPLAVSAPQLGEGTEGQLVQIAGTVRTTPTKGTSGDLTIEVVDASGRSFRANADGSAGIASSDIPRNQVLRLVGIVGQRASRKDALDGYRIWLRDRGDISIVPGTSPSASPSAAGTVSIATALEAPDGTRLSIEATVTAGGALLDSSGRRVVVQDDSAAIEVLLPLGTAAPGAGTHLRIVGEKAHAWGAPRLKAASVSTITTGPSISPAARAASLTERDEWRLVRLSGTVLSVERMGDRWRAEVRLPNGDQVPILGQAGAAIPSTSVVEGRAVTITGIVKRPYPTATDRRFGLLPRSSSDLAVGPGTNGAQAGGSGSGATAGDDAIRAGARSGGIALTGAASGEPDITPDTDLATLFEHIGSTVHVGGLISELTADGFLLDDGTATARVVLHGDALVLLAHLQVGDALAARGIVQQDGEALLVSVASAADLVRVGDLGQALPMTGSGADVSPEASLAAAGPRLAGATGLEAVPAELSVATIAGISALSLLVTLLRRRAAARRSRVVVLARLASLTRSQPK
jgi:hypothetical protein